MEKIISLFKRNYETDHLVRNEIVEGAEWVLKGEGIATRKWDGTCCLVKDGILYKRYDAKADKEPPKGFIAAQDPDPKTGHWPGWLEISSGPEDKWHREAAGASSDGTYELCGPKINGNKEKLENHKLIKHGEEQYPQFPRTFEGIKKHFETTDIEGVVWHNPDGRMVKIKKRDFGIRR
jgi:Family of unknown function (DUF5565)